MKIKEQVARTLANLESLELADAGKTIQLTKQIIATLEARRGLILGVTTGEAIGRRVMITLPTLTGTMRVAGRVTRVMPNGKIEVRTPDHGYHVVEESELVA